MKKIRILTMSEYREQTTVTCRNMEGLWGENPEFAPDVAFFWFVFKSTLSQLVMTNSLMRSFVQCV